MPQKARTPRAVDRAGGGDDLLHAPSGSGRARWARMRCLGMWILPCPGSPTRWSARAGASPRQVAWGADASRCVNRRFRMKDGSVRMNPAASTPIWSASRADRPEVGALFVDTRGHRRAGNYALHYGRCAWHEHLGRRALREALRACADVRGPAGRRLLRRRQQLRYRSPAPTPAHRWERKPRGQSAYRR